MKKISKPKLIVIFIIVILVILFTVNNNDNNYNNYDNDTNLRIRVIASSNSDDDIIFKEFVASEVKKIVNANDKVSDVKRKLNKINDKINELEEKYNVKIAVELGKTKFPVKQLNGKIVPGGVYETLLVTIGEGKGNNYWTILYPEYFGITFEDIYSGEVEVRWFIFDKINELNGD